VKYRVASVPYLNAKPLVKPIEWLGAESPVQVGYRVPSQLPALLESGEAEAIMVSSIYALSNPGLVVAAGLSISTRTKVESVRLFSRVPFRDITTVAWDASSMTSNALTRILLQELYGIWPEGERQPPVQREMLKDYDACVMIGDKGMAGSSDGLYVMDLGEAWHDVTGLPFVWAMWVGRDDLSPELVAHLQWSHREAMANLDRVIEEASDETGFAPDQCRHYFAEIMDYGLSDKHLAGLTLFGEKASQLGIIDRPHPIQVVESAQPALAG